MKGDDPKFEEKDNNTDGTVGAHGGDTTPPEESTAPNGGASIGDHILEANEQSSRPSQTVEEILGSHSMSNDDFWGGFNPSDMSIDTVNSKEITTGSHITKQSTYKYQRPVLPELLNVAPKEPQTYDLPQNYQLDSLNRFKVNILSKRNNVAHTICIDFFKSRK